VFNLKISPVQKERVASVLLQEVDLRNPLPCICFPKIAGVNIVYSMNEQTNKVYLAGWGRNGVGYAVEW
jgi:hypothetical protein